MKITYANVPLSVIMDKSLTGEEFRLYCLILQRAHTQGFCWSSTATLAAEVQTTVRRVGQLLRNLEGKNYIKRFNQSEETENGRKITGRKIYPQVFVPKKEEEEESQKKAYPKARKKHRAPSPKLADKEISLSSSIEEEERRKENNSSYVVSSSLQEETPKAVAPEPQERNTVSSQPAGFTTAASGLDKKILALTDNLHTNASWNEYMKGKYGSVYRESDEYEKMAKALRS